jgi:hypothetical protein
MPIIIDDIGYYVCSSRYKKVTDCDLSIGMYPERRTRLDRRKAEPEHEKAVVVARLEIPALPNEQAAQIEAFCAGVREGLK